METKFEIDDVVHWEGVGEYTVTSLDCGSFTDHIMLAGIYTVETSQLRLIRRASAQREGGFAVGQRVRAKKTAAIHKGRVGAIAMHVIDKHWAVLFDGDPATDACSMGEHELEPADPAPALTNCKRCSIENDGHYVQLDPEGLCGHCVADLMNGGPQVVPPHPAPMTRAARVLAKMERDPYLQSRIDCSGVPRPGKRAAPESGNPKDGQTRLLTDGHQRNEAARLRMAKMSLDRELTHDPKRWAQLYGPVHPVTSRAVRGRR